MLFTHCDLSVLRSAVVAHVRANHNKAACALANKIARICFAVLRDGEPFDQPAVRLTKKNDRQTFAMAA